MKARLDAMKATQEDAVTILTRLESRVDFLHQELQRTASIVQRLKLLEDSEKSAAHQQSIIFGELRDQLAHIEMLLKEKS